MTFPCGPALEILAEGCTESAFNLKMTVQDGYVSLSGPETQLQRYIQSGMYSPPLIAKTTQTVLAKGICKMLQQVFSSHSEVRHIVAVGGVLENKMIRRTLTEWANQEGKECYFAPAKYSADNASGAAFYGVLQE